MGGSDYENPWEPKATTRRLGKRFDHRPNNGAAERDKKTQSIPSGQNGLQKRTSFRPPEAKPPVAGPVNRRRSGTRGGKGQPLVQSKFQPGEASKESRRRDAIPEIAETEQDTTTVSEDTGLDYPPPPDFPPPSQERKSGARVPPSSARRPDRYTAQQDSPRPKNTRTRARASHDYSEYEDTMSEGVQHRPKSRYASHATWGAPHMPEEDYDYYQRPYMASTPWAFDYYTSPYAAYGGWGGWQPPPTVPPPSPPSPPTPPSAKPDPEKEALKQTLALLQAEQARKEAEAKQKEIEAKIRDEAEANFRRQMAGLREKEEIQRRANLDAASAAAKQIADAKKEAERATRESIEAQREADEDRVRENKRFQERIEKQVRDQILAEIKDEEERKKKEAEDLELVELRLRKRIELERRATVAESDQTVSEKVRTRVDEVVEVIRRKLIENLEAKEKVDSEVPATGSFSRTQSRLSRDGSRASATPGSAAVSMSSPHYPRRGSSISKADDHTWPNRRPPSVPEPPNMNFYADDESDDGAASKTRSISNTFNDHRRLYETRRAREQLLLDLETSRALRKTFVEEIATALASKVAWEVHPRPPPRGYYASYVTDSEPGCTDSDIDIAAYRSRHKADSESDFGDTESCDETEHSDSESSIYDDGAALVPHHQAEQHMASHVRFEGGDLVRRRSSDTEEEDTEEEDTEQEDTEEEMVRADTLTAGSSDATKYIKDSDLAKGLPKSISPTASTPMPPSEASKRLEQSLVTKGHSGSDPSAPLSKSAAAAAAAAAADEARRRPKSLFFVPVPDYKSSLPYGVSGLLLRPPPGVLGRGSLSSNGSSSISSRSSFLSATSSISSPPPQSQPHGMTMTMMTKEMKKKKSGTGKYRTWHMAKTGSDGSDDDEDEDEGDYEEEDDNVDTDDDDDEHDDNENQDHRNNGQRRGRGVDLPPEPSVESDVE